MPKRGRPTSYKKEYADKIIAYFDRPAYIETVKRFTTKNGSVIEEPIRIPNVIPTFDRFAHEVCNTDHKRLHEWKKQSADFRDAYARAQGLRKAFLVIGGGVGTINPVWAKFCAGNFTDMRDQISVSAEGLEDVLGALRARKSGKKTVDKSQADPAGPVDNKAKKPK
jgi:hypothetical protein